jgi:hypothetical protein
VNVAPVLDAVASLALAKAPPRPGDDVLAALPEDEVKAWYRRLAVSVRGRNADSLAAQLMEYWLDGPPTGADGKRPELSFAAAYVKDLEYVTEHLREDVRPVFLSETKTSRGVLGGVVPRIKGTPPHPRWDGASPFAMTYQGKTVEVPLSIQGRAALGLPVNEKDLDILMALHGFNLQTEVTVRATPTAEPGRYAVTFERWSTIAFDTYDWNYDEHLTVPNPDYGNPDGLARPVAKTKQKVRVYHYNAGRLERAGKAAPFDVRSTAWTPTDADTVGPAEVEVG